MVDGGYDPRYSKTHKDVDRVAARNVSDGVVRRLLRGGRNLAGEGVGQGGAEGHEGDGRDLNKQSLQLNSPASWLAIMSYLRVESDDAAEYLRQVADHDDGQADHGEGDDEAGVAAQEAGRRNDGEDQLQCLCFSFQVTT